MLQVRFCLCFLFFFYLSLSADIPLQTFENTFERRIGTHAVSYYCRSDRALKCSRLNLFSSAPHSGHRRLGHRPTKRTRQFVTSVRVPKPMVKKVDPMFLHTYFCCPELLQDIVVRMSKPDWPPSFRGLIPERNHFVLVPFEEQKQNNNELKREGNI